MRKRWIIAGIVALVLAGSYTGYWFWLAQTFERNLSLWIEQQRAMGYQITYTASEPHGFPLPVQIDLTSVAVEPPTDGTPWHLDTESMQLSIAPWSPLALRIDNGAIEPEYRLRWAAGGRDRDITVAGLSVVVLLSIDAAPPAIQLRAHSVNFREDGRYVAGMIRFSGDIGIFNVSSHTESSVTFDFSAHGINFILTVPEKTIETYNWNLAGRIMGRVPAEPLPRALASWSDDGGYVELTQFKANWEAVTDVNVNGSVALDPQLQPVASMTTHLRNYTDLIDWLVSIEALTPTQATATRFALAAKSKPAADGSRELEAQVPFTIQDGYLSVGAAKIARVPRIIWH